MNYLAHIFLSFENPEILLGNFIGDMIRPKEFKILPKEIQKGVELHRKIDAFTDKHPLIKKSVRIIKPTQGKYSPVVLDIYCDYFLCKFWNEFSNEDFDLFKQRTYSVLLEKLDSVPPRIAPRIRGMIMHEWLDVYQEKDTLQSVFDRVRKIARFDNNMDNAIHDLSNLEEELSECFLGFFPDLISEVRDEI